jgi:hypothetical protein
MLVEEFKQDYFNNMSIDDLKAKYQIGQTTYFTLLRKLNIKRRPSSKIAKILGENFKPDYIPKKIEPNPDILDKELIYDKQYVPRNTEIVVNKTKPKVKPVVKKEPVLKEVDENELNAILDKAENNITRIQKKKQEKQDDTNNKSELLNAINRSTRVREKILNKKNNNKIE